jgi:pyruvate ferredoxin oxidoreductase gamma subunit
MQDYQGSVQEGGSVPVGLVKAPNWIDLPFDDAQIAAPAIHSAASSERLKTGLWRTQKPVIDERHCNHCWWICSTFCPEGAINVDSERKPSIDYDHCKGCMICLVQCPAHAIEAHPEQENNERGLNDS